MRPMTMILIALCAASTGYADTIDPDDHASFCARMAQVHDWAEGSPGVANCPCSVAGLQDKLTPELFQITLQWQLDTATLPGNLPNGMSITNFYDTIAPVFGDVEDECGPMR